MGKVVGVIVACVLSALIVRVSAEWAINEKNDGVTAITLGAILFAWIPAGLAGGLVSKVLTFGDSEEKKDHYSLPIISAVVFLFIYGFYLMLSAFNG